MLGIVSGPKYDQLEVRSNMEAQGSDLDDSGADMGGPGLIRRMGRDSRRRGRNRPLGKRKIGEPCAPIFGGGSG